MEENPEVEEGLAEYLARLQGELDSLERFPRSSVYQALILCLSAPLLAAGFAGISLLPVPLYLILPFVVLPGWRLVRQELWWREKYRTTSALIQLAEQRRSRVPTGRRV